MYATSASGDILYMPQLNLAPYPHNSLTCVATVLDSPLHTCRFFQQLVDAVAYCHKEGVVHRDLRMEHLLLDGSIYSPLLKLTGFGYSKSEILDSQPKSNVGTPAYVPPEVLMARDSKSYDGQAMDVWACGVILFLMLTGKHQDSTVVAGPLRFFCTKERGLDLGSPQVVVHN